MAMLKICLALAALAAVQAAPNADSVVPENQEFTAAESYVTELLQSGKDSNACADLASALEKEVTDAVNGLNKELAGLSDGANCVANGQEAQTAAQAKLDAANKAEQDAQKACQDAKSAPITWTQTLDSVDGQTCTQFFSDPAYTSAVQAKKTACDAAIVAAAEASAAEAVLEEAKEAATRARHVCQCKAKYTMESAIAEAKKGDADRAASWNKAHHMACVLKGTPANECQVPAVPALAAADMHGDVANAVCFGYVAKTVAETGLSCPTSCPRSATTLSGKIQCINFSTDADTSDADCTNVNAKKPEAHTKKCNGVNWGQGNCFVSSPRGSWSGGCYNIYGGCNEELREGWSGEERRECFGSGRLRCVSEQISGNTKYLGCYRSGNNCYQNRL